MSIPSRLSSEVIEAAKTIWPDQVIAEKITANALEIIANVNKSNFVFFSGKSSRGLIGGLFYLLGFRYDAAKKQTELAEKLGTTDVTIRDSYRKWLNEFPDLFRDVIGKFEENEKGSNCLQSNDKNSHFQNEDVF
ncbi:hypothetical protein JXA31_02655 [Candidatus Bathyarchaeota archaeon]|nr:hypothetical protein [Candidatus Bathyarchaeota archaeon]